MIANFERSAAAKLARVAAAALAAGATAARCLTMLRAALAECCIVVAIEHDRHASDLDDLASLLGDTRAHRSEVVTAMRQRAARLRGSGMADVLASIELDPTQGSECSSASAGPATPAAKE